MKPYVVAPSARRDLNAIWDYIAENDQRAADRFIARIADTLELLGSMPGIGHVREDVTDPTLRTHAVGRYLIIYRFEARPIEVVRVVHGHRDLTRVL